MPMVDDWFEAPAFEPASAPPTSFDGDDDLGTFEGERFDGDGVTGSIRSYRDRPLAVLRIEATRDLRDIANGQFATPNYAWRLGPGREGTVGFGFQYTEF